MWIPSVVLTMILTGGGKQIFEDPLPRKDKYVARAPRFPIETRMQYREGGESAWHEGTTINISRSGVLFKSDRTLEPRRVLEMRIEFPPEFTGDTETGVVCWGPVVRHQPVSQDETLPAMAASIFHYRFRHS